MYSNNENGKNSHSLNISSHSRETNTDRRDSNSFQSLSSNNYCEVEINERQYEPEEYLDTSDNNRESARLIPPSENSKQGENNMPKKRKLQYEIYDAATGTKSPFNFKFNPDDTRRFNKSKHHKTELCTQIPYFNFPQNPAASSQYDNSESSNNNYYELNNNNNKPANNNYYESNNNNESANYNNNNTACHCCPLSEFYNQHYMHKIMQRNAQLEQLAKNLVITRQKEKQKEAWNNYINELKTKHQYYMNGSRQTQYYTDEDPNFYGSSSEPQFFLNEGNVRDYEELFEELYGSYDNWNETHRTGSLQNVDSFLYGPYASEHVCFPTSSQSSRYIVMNREPPNRVNRSKSQREHMYKAAMTNKSHRTKSKPIEKNLSDIKNNRIVKSSSLLTHSMPITKLPLVDEEVEAVVDNSEQNVSTQKPEDTKAQLKRVSENVIKLRQNIKRSEEALKISSLAHLESKIDNLVKSVNILRLELKETRTNYCRTSKSTSISCKISRESNAQLNINRSETYGIVKTDEISYNVTEPRNKKINTNEIACDTIQQRESETVKMDRIIVEEMHKSNKIKRDIGKLLNIKDEPLSVHISFDIPTKEIPDWDSSNTSSKFETQIKDTESFSEDKFKKRNVEKVTSANSDKNIEEATASHPNKECTTSSEHKNRVAIAVNTEPLGLLTLLRLSTHSLKQVLSFLLSLNKYTIVRLPLDNLVAAYVCNICGAAFERPTDLSKHIVKQHNIGKTRDCGVCHQVLEKQRKHRVFFTCQYCGQKFTRAYCCELHQQSCAKHFGKIHDISSSQMLLR